VDPEEVGGKKEGKPLLLVPPKRCIIDQVSSGREQRGIGPAADGAQPLCRLRQQVFEPNRILTDLPPGDVRR